jgi:uncharacterized membrane protein YgcG
MPYGAHGSTAMGHHPVLSAVVTARRGAAPASEHCLLLLLMLSRQHMRNTSLVLAGVTLFPMSAAQAAPTAVGALPSACNHGLQFAQTPAGPPETGTPRTKQGAPDVRSSGSSGNQGTGVKARGGAGGTTTGGGASGSGGAAIEKRQPGQ